MYLGNRGQVNENSKQTSQGGLIPFLKWAGGKRWLVESHGEMIRHKFRRYVEPFLGGGSVFFYLQPKKSILADTNERLIEVYEQIRDDWQSLNQILSRHNENHNKIHYYLERKRKYSTRLERSAQFIYLNRTCWNGLYRVNLKGDFNVPMGSKTKVILDTDDFEKISTSLKGAKLYAQDFEITIKGLGKGDFIYVDPPYTVNHKFNGFLKYNERIFSWQDQIRLRNAIFAAVENGAEVAVSNADHQSIRELYAGIGKMTCLRRKSVIAGQSAKRGSVDELLFLSCSSQ